MKDIFNTLGDGEGEAANLIHTEPQKENKKCLFKSQNSHS